MSSDEYALALAQKYRLAISMAVLKTKPENLTINEYINEIRDVIIDRNKDTSQPDFDMTACSDDFNIDNDDDDEIMTVDFPHDLNDVKSVSNHPRNDWDNSNQNELQQNERQIDNDYRNDDKLTYDRKVYDKAVRINLNEDEIGTQDYCSKRQVNDNISQCDGNRPQCIGINQNDGNIIRSYEKCDKIGIRSKVNRKGIEISGDKARAIDITQDNQSFRKNAHRSQENENKTQMTDTNIGETEKHDPNKERRNKFREVIKILKGVDVSIEKVVKEQLITTPGIIKSFDPTDLDLTQCYDDNNDSFLHVDRLAYSDCESNFQNHVNNKQSNNYDTMDVCNSATIRNTPNEIINLAPKDRQEVRKRKTDFYAQKNTNSDAKLNKITKTDIETVKINPRNSIGNNTQYYAMENNHIKANNTGQNEVHFSPKTTIFDYESMKHMEVSNSIAIQDIDPVGAINTQDTQLNTHYSESQMFDIVIDKNLIYGNRNQSFGVNADTNKVIDGNTNQDNTEDRTISIFTHKTKDLLECKNVTNNATKNEFSLTECQDAIPSQGFYSRTDNCTENGIALSFDTNDRLNIDTEFTIDILQNDRKTVKDLHKDKTNCPSQGFYTRTDNCTENGIRLSFDTNDRVNIENNTEFEIDILQNDRKTVKDLHSDKNNVANTQIYQINTERENIIENNTAFLQTQDMNLTQNSLISTQVYEDNKKTHKNNEIDTTENENNCTDFDKSTDIDDAETTEKVPFKIVEEMNQIKSYLSKKREFKDSGYKSSQSQRSGIGTQPSSLRVGESADAVFIYLTSCPLDVSTQELIEQISEVLGQVIDRLHEEQVYPKFLEELLNTIEKLLHLVYEEENYDFDVLRKKDEQIQRIILLNKSSHINKFTIEKINNILQKLINEISDTDYEIREINQLENLCYIFHILQIILPKYIQGNLYNSQASQSSQEQKVLKKQDISDIWRKKWFTNTKEVENEGSLENKCVLKECSALLNKIIVDFMDGYSLIAFSALKCFNLIQ